MNELSFPSGLQSIEHNYDAILCDVWGVIHNGRKAFEEACDALVKFRGLGKKVCLITNAPVPKPQVIRYFEPLGVPADAFDDCVSSGDATREELKSRSGQAIWRMGADEGWEHDRFLYEGLDIRFTGPEHANLLLCIGLDDQLNDDPEDYRGRLMPGVERNLPMLCANPDVKVRVGDKLYWCAGALAEVYKDMGGQVIYPGKPHSAIYELALAKINNPDLGRTLCIGDSPATDMRGAANHGMDSLYVGTGLNEHGTDFRGEVTDLLAAYNVRAAYAMPGLAW